MTLSDYLRDQKLKPSAFAAEIGVPPSTITRLLNGERQPGLALIGKIRDRTGGAVTADDFIAAAAERAA